MLTGKLHIEFTLLFFHPSDVMCTASGTAYRPSIDVNLMPCLAFFQPHKTRPATSAIAARRLVTSALGMNSNVPREKRALESKVLQAAKGESCCQCIDDLF